MSGPRAQHRLRHERCLSGYPAKDRRARNVNEGPSLPTQVECFGDIEELDLPAEQLRGVRLLQEKVQLASCVMS